MHGTYSKQNVRKKVLEEKSEIIDNYLYSFCNFIPSAEKTLKHWNMAIVLLCEVYIHIFFSFLQMRTPQETFDVVKREIHLQDLSKSVVLNFKLSLNPRKWGHNYQGTVLHV